MKKKIYLLDTNVLIHDARALFAFKEAWIGIAIPVLEELDKFKAEPSARGRNAREAIRTLDKLRDRGSLSQGVILDNGATIQILMAPQDIASFGLDLSDHDNQILSIALSIKKAHDLDVYFISKDLNMRVKADALGLVAEDYQREFIAEDDFYKGWVSIPVHAGDLQDDQPAVLQDILHTQTLFYNEYVQLVSERNPENYRIFRYCGEKIFKPVYAPRNIWSIIPRNPQQFMAFDLLFNDDIQLVVLFGPAGTGKTFLALVSALHKLLIEHAYKKILIARPVEPLGRDVGYLPGDLQEKLYSWMQPVRDNWEFIASRAHASYDHSAHEAISSQKESERKGRGRGRGKKGSHVGIPTVEELMREDRLSLEAITYMRGRSIPKQYILIDEVQNLTPHEVKTLVTRVGEGSKIILAGDPYQIDSPYLDFASNGLVVTNERFKGQRIFGSVFLERSERSELSDLAAQLL